MSLELGRQPDQSREWGARQFVAAATEGVVHGGESPMHRAPLRPERPNNFEADGPPNLQFFTRERLWIARSGRGGPQVHHLVDDGYGEIVLLLRRERARDVSGLRAETPQGAAWR